MLGTWPNRQEAGYFWGYLQCQGIESHIDAEDDGVVIWVEKDDDLPRAKQFWTEFQANPQAEQFQVDVKAILKSKAKPKTSRVKNVRMQDVWYKQMHGSPPVVTAILIALSIIISLVTEFGHNMERVGHKVFISEYETHSIAHPQPTVEERLKFGLMEVRQGEVWRLVSPIFLHLSPLHLIFNMFWMYSLGRYMESQLGPVKFALFVLGAGVFSNLLQFYWAGPAFGGMSGVVYAIFGYIWLSGYLRISAFQLDDIYVTMFFIWLMLGLFGMVAHVAHGAHLGGMAFGLAWCWIPYALRQIRSR
jgi:GlpG protein